MNKSRSKTAKRRISRDALNRFLTVLLTVAMVLQTSPLSYAEELLVDDAVKETVSAVDEQAEATVDEQAEATVDEQAEATVDEQAEATVDEQAEVDAEAESETDAESEAEPESETVAESEEQVEVVAEEEVETISEESADAQVLPEDEDALTTEEDGDQPEGIAYVPEPGIVTYGSENENKFVQDKTATPLDWNDDTTVTLTIGSDQESAPSDIVFVVDKSTSDKLSSGEVTDLLATLLAASQANNATIKVGVSLFNFKGNEWLPLTEVTNDNYATLFNNIPVSTSNKTASADIPRMQGGTNLEAGLQVAKDMLDEDTAVPADHKFMIVISDAYTWCFLDESGNPVNIKTGNKNDTAVIGGTAAHDGIFGTLHYPADHWTSWADHWNQVTEWVMADRASGDYLSPIIVDTSVTTYTSGGVTYQLYGGSYSQTPNATDFANENYIPYDERYKHALTVDRALYEAWEVYDAMVQSGYNCYGVDSNINDDGSYTLGWTLGDEWMQWVNGGKTIDFDDIQDYVLYLLSTGSKVVDYIGFSDADGSAYNLDFITDADTLSLTVGSSTYEAKVLTQDGSVWRYGFKPNSDGTEYAYEVEYHKGDLENGEYFDWFINESLPADTALSLTYKLHLSSSTEEPGTYTAPTNNSATLYPIDSAGNPDDPEDFPEPEVEYRVIDVEKIWEDDNNGRNTRPESVTITLKGTVNGVAINDTSSRSYSLTLDGTADTVNPASGRDLSDDPTGWETSAWHGKWTRVHTVDPNGNTISYTVSEDQIANYEAPVIASTATGFTVTNTLPDVAEGEVKVKKVLDGRAWTDDDEFTFTLSAASGTPMPPKTEVTITKDDAGKTESFGKIKFTKAGTYTYTVTETKGSADGVAYDTTPHSVTIVLEDDGEGNLVAAEGSSLVQAVTVTNTFAPASAGIAVTKSVKDDDWGNAESFTFEIAAGSNDAGVTTPMPASTSVTVTKANKVGSFGDVEYEKAGTYNYTITELNDGSDGMSYDVSDHTATVVVTKGADNALSATVTYDGGASSLTIENEYAPTTATIEATKEFNDWGKADSFEFTLAAVTEGAPMPAEAVRTATEGAETVSWADIEYRKAGTYEYTVTETDGEVDGVSYDTTPHTVTVTVTKADDATNALSAEVTYEDEAGLVITNTFAPAKATIEATKAYDNWGSETNEFEFTLAAVTEGAPMPAEAARTATADAKTVSWADIEFEKAGTYEYTVTETDGGAAYVTYDTEPHTVTVTVTKADDATNALTVTNAYDDGAEALTVTNAYSATGEAVVDGTKAMAGREFHEGDEFTFTIDGDGPLPEETSVTIAPASGTEFAFAFGAIAYGFGDAGKTYTYTVTEAGEAPGVTNDAAVHTVTVTVADNGDGTLAVEKSYSDGDQLLFTNAYAADGTVTLVATKVYKGGTLKAGQFSFELLDADGKVIQTKSNAADGSVTFDPIAYTLGDAGSTFAYTIREVIPAGAKRQADGTYKVGNLTYDGHSEAVTVEVADNGDGKLTATAAYDADGARFTNTYKPDVPHTGDPTPRWLAFAFAAGAVVLVAGVVLRKRREDEE